MAKGPLLGAATLNLRGAKQARPEGGRTYAALQVLATLGRVHQDEAADANTLFNVVQRLGGSFGIALLATFLQVREQVHVNAVLEQVGLGGLNLSNPSASLVRMPPAIRQKLAGAALAGFHDMFLVLTVVSLVGLALALFLEGRRGERVFDRTDRQTVAMG